jgi:hypothetical protein
MESADRPPPAKTGLPPVVFVYLGVIVMTWAGNWPLMKLALGQVSPLVFVLAAAPDRQPYPDRARISRGPTAAVAGPR